jgi:TRAP-type transport system small permease protein
MLSWVKLDRLMTRGINIITGASLIIMMLTIVINIIGRTFWGSPIFGTVEIVSLAGVFLLSFAIGYTEQQQSHIVVTMLVSRFQQWLRLFFVVVTLFLSAVIVAVLAWGGLRMAIADATTRGATTYMFHISTAPFRFVWGLGCVVFFGFLLKSLMKAIDQVRKK